MRGVVKLGFGPEGCCGVVVSKTHILTSQHQLNGAVEAIVDDGTTDGFRVGQVVVVHETADVAVVAVAEAVPSWLPQSYGSGLKPPVGETLELNGVSRGPWSELAVCQQAAAGQQGVFIVETKPRNPGAVPCLGDSGGPAWLEDAVVGVCSEPVGHRAGCVDDQMRYTFITPTLKTWIDQAKQIPYRKDVDDIPHKLLRILLGETSSGASVAEVARRLGVSKDALASWRIEQGLERSGGLDASRSPRYELAELRRVIVELAVDNQRLRRPQRGNGR